MSKDYDQKFVFGWKGNSLDFQYVQANKLPEKEINKSFDFGEGSETLNADYKDVKPEEPKLLQEVKPVPTYDELMAKVNPPSPLETVPVVDVPVLTPVPNTVVTPEEIAAVMPEPVVVPAPVSTDTPTPSIDTAVVDAVKDVGTAMGMTPVDAPEAMTHVEGTPLQTIGFDLRELPSPPVEAAPETPVAAPPAPAPVVDVLVNANVETEPTVQVRLPETMPQIVAADVAQIDQTKPIDPASPHAQVVVELSDATVKVPDDSTLVPVSTPDGKSDIVVAVTPDVQAAADAVGIDIQSTVAKAVDVADLHPNLPDLNPSVVEDPKPVLPQVVGVSVADNTVTLTDVSAKIPENSVLIPVETPPEMPNIVAAISPETMDKFKDSGVDPAKALSDYVYTAPVEVATVNPVAQSTVYDTNGVEYVPNEDMSEYVRWYKHGDSA